MALNTAPSELTAPRQVLLGMWLTLLVLTLLTAVEQREEIVRDSVLGTQGWAVLVASSLVEGARALRLTELYDDMRAVAAKVVPSKARHGAVRPGPDDQGDDASDDGRDAASSPPTLATTGPTRYAGSSASASAVNASAVNVIAPDGSIHGKFDLAHARVRRILLIGASSMQFYLGAELERLIGANYEGTTVIRRGKVSTGLARPDLLDWPRELAILLDEFHPDLIVSDFGGNDAQNMVLDDGRVCRYGTDAWDSEYRARVAHMVELSHAGGARVALLGMPSMRNPSFARKMRHLNELIASEASRLGAVFIPTWDLASDAQGRYRRSITVDGVDGLARLPDGKHFSRLGAIHVGRELLPRLEQAFVLVPKDSKQSIVVRRDLASKMLGRTVPYLSYVPQSAARGPQRLPTLFLLHGAEGSFMDWPSHAHRLLQQLSTTHRMIIVVPDGGPDGWYIDSPQVATHRYASWLVQELLPDVRASLPSNGRRSIAGQSAGGHGALTLALTHPGVFTSASSMSGVLDLPAASNRPALISALGPYTDNADAWQARSARHLVARRPGIARRLPMLISVGSQDRWAEINRSFIQELENLDVPYVYRETTGGHDFDYWVSELPHHVAWHASQFKQSETP